MKLGDARSGKLPENIIGFGRALRRAGVPIDSQRMALAIEAARLVGLERKDDLHAALGSVLINRQQDIGRAVASLCLQPFNQLVILAFDDIHLNTGLLLERLEQLLVSVIMARRVYVHIRCRRGPHHSCQQQETTASASKAGGEGKRG
jgi:uncharacterized protein with von Willebrand factor type A (vWA) domain